MRKAAIILFILVSFVAVAAQQGSAPASVPSVALPPELDRVLRDYESAWAAKDAAQAGENSLRKTATSFPADRRQ
jgi:hypothetical protein